MMNSSKPFWRGGVMLRLALLASLASTTAHAQLVSTASNDAFANNTALRFNYAEALQKSVYFVEAQQNGPLSPNNRVAWRGNANLSDGSDIGRNLAGGLFDAGDHWTANLTMAFVTTMLAWSAVEKPTGWTSTGQMEELLETLIHVNDYFIKCVLNPNVSNPAQNLDVVIGCGGKEGVPNPNVHTIWAGAEMADVIDSATGQRITNRPTFRLNATAPGGDIPAAMASAMAASAMVIRTHGSLLAGKNGFASFNPTAYADQLYDLAGKLAHFANANEGAANPNAALRSDGQIVDIGYRGNAISHTFTALTWLARATSDAATRQSWVTLAEQVYEGPYKAANLHASWRDNNAVYMGKLGAYNMIRLFPTSEKYHYEVQEYATSFLSYGQTPGGLRLRERYAHEYGSLRHSNNAGAITLYYSDLVDNAPVLSGNTWWKYGASNATLKAEFIRAAKRSTDYALGANPYGRSYLVGFGNQPFNNSHHRGAHGAWNGFEHFISGNQAYNPDTSRNIVYGAMLAGPDNQDVFLCGDNNRTWAQVPGTPDFDIYYIFPNRPTEPVRKSTYVFNTADQPVQEIIDSQFNEIALDYNAGFMANLAWLNSNGYSNGSPIADSQFPPALVRNESLDPWTTDREMLVTATLTEDSSSATQLDGRVWNRSRWPARALTSPRIRYYFTHTGTVTPTLSNATGASISAVLTDGAGQRYVEITWSGVTLNPVNSSNNVRDFTLRLAATGWNSSDDWSRQNAALNTLRLLPNTPVYQAGALVGGAPPGTAPSAPSALSVVANSSTQLTLNWTDNATNETGFRIERSANGSTGWSQIATPSTNATTFANTGLTASTTYFYRVRATNATGDSAYTSVANAATLAAGGGALITIEAEDYDTGGQNVAYNDTDASNNGGAYRPAEGVDLESCSEGGFNIGWTSAGEWTQYTVTVSASGNYDLTFRVSSSGGGGPLRLTVDGVALSGDLSVPSTGGWQNWSNVIRTGVSLTAGQRVIRITSVGGNYNLNRFTLAATAMPAPAAPSLLSATANSSTQLTLTWTDNANNETGFKIERSANGTTGWTQIAAQSANATTYVDTGLATGTAYYYRVRATNAAGDSVYTSTATATTQGTIDVTIGLAARLSLDETSGTSAADSTGNGKTGTLQSGASLVAGKINNGVSLNGSSGHVAMPFVFNPSAQADLTVTAWVRLTTANAGPPTILQQEDNTGLGRTWLYRNASGQLASFLGNAETTSSATLLTGIWYHVALVKTGSSLQLYVNGAANGSPTTRTVESCIGAMRIGTHKSTTNQYWNGLIDEVRFYNRALSGSELATVAAWSPSAPAGLQTFRTTYGLATNGSQDLLTPAGDGVANLLKYAFNLLGTGTGQAAALATPNAAVLIANGSAGLPLVGVGTGSDEGKLQLTYIRRKASSAPGITYAVEFSDALSSWAVNVSATELVTSIDATFERVTTTDSLATSTKRFVRVKISVP